MAAEDGSTWAGLSHLGFGHPVFAKLSNFKTISFTKLYVALSEGKQQNSFLHGNDRSQPTGNTYLLTQR